MEIIIIKKTTFDMIQKNNVTSVSINTTSKQWTVISASGTEVYSTEQYDVRIIG